MTACDPLRTPLPHPAPSATAATCHPSPTAENICKPSATAGNQVADFAKGCRCASGGGWRRPRLAGRSCGGGRDGWGTAAAARSRPTRRPSVGLAVASWSPVAARACRPSAIADGRTTPRQDVPPPGTIVETCGIPSSMRFPLPVEAGRHDRTTRPAEPAAGGPHPVAVGDGKVRRAKSAAGTLRRGVPANQSWADRSKSACESADCDNDRAWNQPSTGKQRVRFRQTSARIKTVIRKDHFARRNRGMVSRSQSAPARSRGGTRGSGADLRRRRRRTRGSSRVSSRIESRQTGGSIHAISAGQQNFTSRTMASFQQAGCCKVGKNGAESVRTRSLH